MFESLFLSFCLAQTPAPLIPPLPPPQPEVIHIPTLQTEPPPPPVPAPMPVGTPIHLPSDVFFIISSKIPFCVVSSPVGVVKINHEKGPMRMRGRFVEAPDEVKTRDIEDPYIVSVEVLVTGHCELLIWPEGLKPGDESQIERRKLQTGAAPPPTPPPTPTPTPTPIPTPTPTPIPTGERGVIFFYERDQLKPNEANVMNSQIVRDYLKGKLSPSEDGTTKLLRFFDQHDDVAKDTKKIQEMVQAIRPTSDEELRKWSGGLPVVVIFEGGRGTSYPLPGTVAELMTLLKSQLGG